MRLLIVVAALLLGRLAWADQIVLHNGDTIEGTFKGIIDKHVLWKSSLFGDLKILKENVKNIHSSEAFKLRGQATPCAWQSLDQHVATFVCHKGEQRRFSLFVLEQVVPFEKHDEANHSYTGNLRVSGLKKQGNVESEYWEVYTGVTLRHGDWRHTVSLSTSGQELELREGTTITQDADRRNRGEYKLDWFFLPKYYLSNVFSAEDDSNRNIQEEYKLSSGLGVQFWERRETALSVVTGLEHNRTYLLENPPPDEPETYTSVRVGTDFSYKFKQGTSVYHTHTYRYALDGPEAGDTAWRWEFRSRSGVDIPIGFGVSSDFHVEWNYKNHAKDLDPNAFRTDTIYRVGVNYGW